MLWFLIGLILLLLFVGFGQAFVQASPGTIARGVRIGGGIVMLLLSALLGFLQLWVVAAPLAIMALTMLGFNVGHSFGAGDGWRGRSRPSSGQRSSVRTGFLAAELDHDSGEISGEVLSGPYAGRTLRSLSESELRRLWQLLANDDQSRPLFEAYLDRRRPGWREAFTARDGAGDGAAAGTQAMGEKEAWQILGLQPGASDDEIRAAHRRLMKTAHPDQGGSTFLAAKINEAKELLLRRRR